MPFRPRGAWSRAWNQASALRFICCWVLLTIPAGYAVQFGIPPLFSAGNTTAAFVLAYVVIAAGFWLAGALTPEQRS